MGQSRPAPTPAPAGPPPPSISDSHHRSSHLPQPHGHVSGVPIRSSAGLSLLHLDVEGVATDTLDQILPSCPSASRSVSIGKSGLSQPVYDAEASATSTQPPSKPWDLLPHPTTLNSVDLNAASSQTTPRAAVVPIRSFDSSFSGDVSLPIATHSSTAVPTLHVRSPSTVQNTDQSYFTAKEVPTQPIPIPHQPLRPSLSMMSVNSLYSVSPGSAISSPALAAMTDITPLPSPILPEDPPSSWRKGHARPGSSGSLSSLREDAQVEDFTTGGASAASSRASSVKKKKVYSNLMPAAVEASGHSKSHTRANDPGHIRHRSLSEYTSEQMHNVRPRIATLSLATAPNGRLAEFQIENPMHRERHLAEQRGFTHHAGEAHAAASFPTPPPSNRSVTESDGDEVMRDEEPFGDHSSTIKLRDHISGRKMQYREIRPLGQGTFSKVVLGTREALPANFPLDEKSESHLNPMKLAAIKIVEHGPVGGADEERMELSLKREIEIMRSISHPCLIHLMAYGINEEEALLILRYCPGGDLFELASEKQDLLKPALVQRIFAELVSAVQFLHAKNIVHRDLKLENVLVNLRREEIAKVHDPQSYPRSIITVTDLGLSRHVDPENPLLQTRCGSEDYAAPEILLSQSYDGRSTDAWALGVVLYALMEGRLPFDAPPPKPGSKIRSRGRAAHRIARCEWIWSRFGDAYGEWEDQLGKGWEGPRAVVEGLLKKVNKGRMTLGEVADHPWVKDGIQVPGGLRVDEEQ